MSKVISPSRSAADAVALAPTTPAAGPERTVVTAFRRTVSASVTPPFACMIRGCGRPMSRARSVRRPT